MVMRARTGTLLPVALPWQKRERTGSSFGSCGSVRFKCWKRQGMNTPVALAASGGSSSGTGSNSPSTSTSAVVGGTFRRWSNGGGLVHESATVHSSVVSKDLFSPSLLLLFKDDVWCVCVCVCVFCVLTNRCFCLSGGTSRSDRLRECERGAGLLA